MKSRALDLVGGLIVGVSMLGLGCPKPKPPQPPKPPIVEPAGPVAQTGVGIECRAGQFFTTDGQPFEHKGCSGCCMDGATGWPCGTAEYIAWLNATGGCNVFEFRFSFTEASEPEWAGVGGDFLEVDGKADLTKPNPRFEERIEHAIEHAKTFGGQVLIDPFDGWRIKHCQWGEQVGCILRADGNVQGEDWLSLAGRTEIKDGTYWASRLRYLAKRFGKHRNVGWLLGNENGQIDGYVPQWDLSIRNVLVDEYARQGWPPPLLVTNSGNGEVEQAVGIDVVAKHVEGVIERAGTKCTINSEFNSREPWSPQQWASVAKQTQVLGAHLWAWRHGQSEEQWLGTLAQMKRGLDGVSAEPCPFEVPTIRYVKVKPHGTDYYDSTPLVTGDGAYCRRVGFTDGRSTCPVRQEGDVARGDCELKAMGGEIQWRLEQRTGDIDIAVRHGGFQFGVTGHGSALVACTTALVGGENICRDEQGQPVRISR